MMTEAQWRALPCPGYDPWATAEDGDYFDVDIANMVMQFVDDHLQVVEGDKEGPLVLEPWQKAIVGWTFGWHRANGTRRYRTVWVYVPRKNGKTCLAAVMMLAEMFIGKELAGQLCSLASDKDQAAILFRFARLMVEASPELQSQVSVYMSRMQQSIVYHEYNTTYSVLSSSAGGRHGAGASMAIIDEVHAHKNTLAMDAVVTGRSARKQPLIVYLTTADEDKPSFCNEEYKYACMVRDGAIRNHEYFPCIYETLETDDWTDEAVWHKANPNLGVSKELDYMRSEFTRAKDSPHHARRFKQLDLNMRVPSAAQWIGVETWNTCGTDSDPMEWRQDTIESLAGQSCCGGFDLSSTSDLTALVLVFRREGRYILLPWFWTPADKVSEKTKADGIPYQTWVDEGWIEATPGNRIDQAFIRKRFKEIIATFEFNSLAFDKWASEGLVRAQLADQDNIECVEFPQGFAMSPHSKRLEALVSRCEISHGDNPVLKWMASNVAVKQDSDGNENIKIVKRIGKGKIDGIIASIMGLAQFEAVYGDADTAPTMIFASIE